MLLLVSENCSSQGPHWEYLTKLNKARRNYLGIQHAVVIAPCKVLVAGGYADGNSSSYGQPTNHCEIIDVCCGKSTPTGSMAQPRTEHILLLTPDSNVVAISGMNQVLNQSSSAGTHTNTVELYNRSTGTWSTIGNILTARRQAQALFISATEILIVGGRLPNLSTIGTSEIFDMSTGTSQFVSNYLLPVNMHVVGKSSAGSTIIAGGRNGGTDATRTRAITKYDRSSNSYISLGSLTDSVRSAQIIKMRDGRLCVSGGVKGESTYRASKQLFIENSDSFTPVSNLGSERWGHGIGQYNNDSLIMIGGNGLPSGSVVSSCEWYSLSQNQVTTAPSLPLPLGSFSWATVPVSVSSSGTILETAVIVIGGVTNSGEFSNATPRDSIYILRSCTTPDSLKTTKLTGTCYTFKMAIDSLNRCRQPAFIRWFFGDNTVAQSTSWSTQHAYPGNGTFLLKAVLYYSDCGDSLVLNKTLSFNSDGSISASPKILNRCAKDSLVQLHATGGVRYRWTPAADLDDSTSANPIARPTKTTKYYVYGWTADSCMSVDSVLVNFSNGIANAGSDVALCSNGDSTLLNVTIPAYTRSVRWTPKLGLACDTCRSTMAKPSVSTNYIATVVDSVGCVWTDTVRVSIRPGSAAKIVGGPVLTVCAGSDSVSLSLSPRTGLRQVRWTPNIGIACDTCFNTKVLPKLALKYVATFIDSLGCVGIDTVQVKVGSNSTQIQSGGPQYICFKGDSTQISVLGKVRSVQWTPANQVSCATCFNTVVKPTSTRYFNYTAVDSAGCPYSDSIKVTVLPKATVDISPDTTICGSSALLVQAFGNYQNVQWSPANGVSCTTCPTTLIIPTPGKTLTYYVTARNGKSVDCETRDSIRVRFAPGIEGQLKDQQVCPGDSVSISLREFGGKVQWSSSPDISCDTCRSIRIKPTKTGRYIVTGDSLGCISRDTITITVAATTLSVPKTLSVCAGKALTIGTVSNSSTFNWTPSTELSCTDCPNPVVRATQSRTYYVTAGKGSCSVRDSVRVDIKPSPVFHASPIDTTICDASPLQITVDVQPAGTLVEWDPNSDLSCYNCPNPIAKPSSNNNWYIARLRTPGGCDSSLRVHVMTSKPPQFQIAPFNKDICDGDSVRLSVISSDSVKLKWSTQSGEALALDCDTCATVSAKPRVTTSYVIKASSTSGCESVQVISINVGARANVVLSPDTSVCVGTKVQLTASGGDSYRWDSNPDLSCLDCPNPIVTATSTNTYHVHVGLQSSPNCWRDTAITITTVPCNIKTTLQSQAIASFFACDSAMSYAFIRNDGDVVLRIDSVKKTNANHASLRSEDLLALNAQLPKTLQPHGDSLGFALMLIPEQSGAAWIELSIYCKDSIRTLRIDLQSYSHSIQLSLPPNFDVRPDSIVSLAVNARSSQWNVLRLHDSVIVNLSIDSSALVYETCQPGSSLPADWSVSLDSVTSSSSFKRFVLRGKSVLLNDGEWLVPTFRTILPSHTTVQASLSAEFPSLRIPCADQDTSGNILTFTSCAFSLRQVEYKANGFALQSIRPNPAKRSRLTVQYSIGTAANAELNLYSIDGKLVAPLASGHHQAGSYELEFSAENLSTGEYIVQLRSHGKSFSLPLLLIP